MAKQGSTAFDTDNDDAPNSHKRLLEVSAVIREDVKLAAMFDVSVPTVRKWRSLPLGYKPGKHGRPKKEKGPGTHDPKGHQDEVETTPASATSVAQVSASTTTQEENHGGK